MHQSWRDNWQNKWQRKSLGNWGSWVFLMMGALAAWLCHWGLSWADTGAYRATIAVTPLIQTTTTSVGQPLQFDLGSPALSAVKVEIPPGQETGWHLHPHPGFAYILQGSLTIETRDRPPQIFTAGSAVVEMVNKPHNGRNLGKDPVVLVAFFTHEEDQPFAVPAPE